MSIVGSAGSGLGGVGDIGGALGSFYSHTLDQSLRGNEADSAYLSRTPSSASNRRTYTISAWIKPSLEVATFSILGAGSSGSAYYIFGIEGDDLYFEETSSGGALRANRKLRDPSAFYHLVASVDTTQATDSNRLKLYVNGVRETSFSTENYMAEDFQSAYINNTSVHYIGHSPAQGSHYLNGYIGEVNFIDGLQLGPDSFGEFKDGIWIPIDTSGLTFGTNGFHLDFADDSAIGNDVSGEDNDFAVSGLAATDVVPDSPTNNFATMNPIHKGSGTTGSIAYSEGNLASSFAGNHTTMQHAATMALPTEGKWYWEQTFTGALTDGSRAAICGIWNDDSQDLGSNNRLTVTSDAVTFYSDDNKIYSSADGSIGNTAYTGSIAEQTGAVVSFAVDMDNTWVWVAVNGTYINGTPDFSDGTNRVDVVTDTNGRYIPFWAGDGGQTITWRVNFGQDSANVSSANSDSNGIGTFEYAVPSGYTSLCSANMPEPSIIDGSEYFNTVLYSGNGGTQDITTVGFQPDWVWNKRRDGAASHVIYDSVRGTGNEIGSNYTAAEATGVSGVTAFLSNGYSLGDNGNINDSGETYASWNWLAGTAVSGDTTGSGTAKTYAGSVNTEAGFSIIKYTGNGTAGHTIPHNLGAKPSMVIFKNRDVDDQWAVYHKDILATHNLSLNLSDGKADQDNRFNDTEPTSSVMTLGTGHVVNANDEDYIAYFFTDIDQYSKAGVYTGNGNADGSYVALNFRPAWVMIKRADDASHWAMIDTARSPYNVSTAWLAANLTSSEAGLSTNSYDILSNGFKARDTLYNVSGGTYIYLAFAEQPFKYANAR